MVSRGFIACHDVHIYFYRFLVVVRVMLWILGGGQSVAMLFLGASVHARVLLCCFWES